jgi:hypothetical protein
MWDCAPMAVVQGTLLSTLVDLPKQVVQV